MKSWIWNVSMLKMQNIENNAVRVFCRCHWRWERPRLDLRQVHLRAERPWFTPRHGKCHLRLPNIIYVRESLSWCSVFTAEGYNNKRLRRGRRFSKFHCPFKRLIVFQNAINYMHTFTHFTRFLLWLSSNTLHIPLKFEHESHRRREKKKKIWNEQQGFFFCFFSQYNVPAPRANECCIELGVCRWAAMELPAEVYHDPEVSKKLEAVVLMLCGCRLCGLEGPCVSQTAGDCGELHAMGSLELGLCSGGSSPFFMIFFNFDLLFWNQILTWERAKSSDVNISQNSQKTVDLVEARCVKAHGNNAHRDGHYF